MDYETKKNNCYSVYGSYDGILDFRLWWCIRQRQKEAVKEAEGTAKEDLPLAKYPETVTVHLGGKMNPNAKIPKGMSFEDNSYTRLLKENLNIQVVYDWTASTSDYDEK